LTHYVYSFNIPTFRCKTGNHKLRRCRFGDVLTSAKDYISGFCFEQEDIQVKSKKVKGKKKGKRKKHALDEV